MEASSQRLRKAEPRKALTTFFGAPGLGKVVQPSQYAPENYARRRLTQQREIVQGESRRGAVEFDDGQYHLAWQYA